VSDSVKDIATGDLIVNLPTVSKSCTLIGHDRYQIIKQPSAKVGPQLKGVVSTGRPVCMLMELQS